MDILDSLEEEHKQNLLIKCKKPVRISRLALYVCFGYSLYSFLPLAQKFWKFLTPTQILLSVVGMLFVLGMAIFSHWRPFASFLIMSILLSFNIIFALFIYKGDYPRMSFFMYLVTDLALIRGLLYAREYERLKNELRTGPEEASNNTTEVV